MKLKYFYPLILILALCLGQFSYAQKDLLKSKRFVAGSGDTALSVNVAPCMNATITFTDSSNSTTDTFKVYIINDLGDEVLAALVKQNDTTAATDRIPKAVGVVIPGNATTAVWQVQYSRPYAIKIVRSNVYTSGNVSHILVYARYSTTGSLWIDPKMKTNLIGDRWTKSIYY